MTNRKTNTLDSLDAIADDAALLRLALLGMNHIGTDCLDPMLTQIERIESGLDALVADLKSRRPVAVA